MRQPFCFPRGNGSVAEEADVEQLNKLEISVWHECTAETQCHQGQSGLWPGSIPGKWVFSVAVSPSARAADGEDHAWGMG